MVFRDLMGREKQWPGCWHSHLMLDESTSRPELGCWKICVAQEDPSC